MNRLEVLDADNPGPRGVLNNKSKGDMLSATSGSAQRRKLADISNLLERANPPNQGLELKKQSTMISSKDYLQKLEKENIMMMQVLVERNKVIELSAVELQNLRNSLHRLQEQNFQLAQANSKMLAELNTNKDRLKALNHELGCKNGLLKARKLLLEEQSNPMTYQTSDNKVGRVEHGEVGNSVQPDDADNKTYNAERRPSGNSTAKFAAGDNGNKKRRVSARKNTSKPEDANSSGISNEATESKENIDGKRKCVRRQSGRFEFQELELSETLPQTRETKETNNNKRRRVRRQSARFEAQEPEQNEASEEIYDANVATETKEISDSKRSYGRRQSARFESRELELSETLPETRDAEETNNSQRRVGRRQSARFESQEPELNETLEEMDDAKETIENERLSEQSTRLTVQASEPAENLHEMHDIKETAKNSRAVVRRQSTRLKEHKGEPIQDSSAIDDTKEKTMKRTSVRRQSTKTKSQEPELSETMPETQDAKKTSKNQGSTGIRRSTIHNSQASTQANNYTDDPRLPNLQLGDNTTLERNPPPLESLKNHHGDGNMSSLETGVCEDIRRTSVGRPMRRAAEKIQTYKEISLRVKMRRSG